MHSLLAPDFATAVVRERVRFARRRRNAPAPAVMDCGCDMVPTHSVKAVVRPAAKRRPREAEAVCV
jgi:hypothetical protein